MTKSKTENDKNDKNALGCGILFVLAFVIFIGILSSSSSPSPNVGTGYISLCVYSEEKVKTLLKAPSSAQFPSCNEQSMTSDGSGNYTYSSYVDATNSFGAMLRTNYSCLIANIDQSLSTYSIYCWLK